MEESKLEPLCFACGKTYIVPFDNGDGEIRCAACAVDRYMKMPGAEVILTEKIFRTDGT
jgi:DNA-directed RNA polymerase subunit RPC12/RpoP